MAMLVIYTQIYENYAWGDDGTLGIGEDAYWKAKGGQEYKILNIPTNVDLNEVVDMAAVGSESDSMREFVVSWSVENDDYLSWSERSQLEYDGKINHPEPTIEYSDLLARYQD